MNKPAVRKLRGYAFDPSFASTITRRQNNEVIYTVRWEEGLKPGPVGEYIEVIDYDPTKECFYKAIDLDDKFVLADYGMSLSEGDPRFHQQQVYAVAMTVIAQFEKALGRKIIWTRTAEKDGSRPEIQFVPRLRIYPHAMRQQNAYYSPEKVALLFGYFRASENWSGNNIPFSSIFTCLSPDIIAHETTHAILDSIYPYLQKNTNPDIPAFHEGFSDIIALLQRFTFTSVVEEQLRNSRGDLLSPQNLLGDLAIQFGQAISSNRRALRSFLVQTDSEGKTSIMEPDPSKYHTIFDPHSRGGLLVAAIFDAFSRLYKYKIADLLRIASNGSGVLAQGELHPDLIKRLANEACEIADKLMLTCIRALDYCPPVDLTFGDFLRALVTADVDHHPVDEDGLRFALMESFRSWGIVPKDITTFSVESLRWKGLEESYPKDDIRVRILSQSIQYVFNSEYEAEYKGSTYSRNQETVNTAISKMEQILREEDREKIFNISRYLSAQVHDIFDLKFELKTDRMEQLLGMYFNPIEYSIPNEDGSAMDKCRAPKRHVFEVHKCRPVIRQNFQDGTISKLLVMQFIQKVYVNLRGTMYEDYIDDNRYSMRGGATLIIDLATYKIKYAIVKNIDSDARLKEQLDYAMENLYDEEHKALLMQDDEPFAALHAH